MSKKPASPLRVAIYSRVSSDRQTTENQERELHAIAGRLGWIVVKVYRDQGISGSKGREGRPAFDALCKDASRRQFDLIAAWSVDRLGQDLVWPGHRQVDKNKTDRNDARGLTHLARTRLPWRRVRSRQRLSAPWARPCGRLRPAPYGRGDRVPARG